jgi:peroxiredoxin
MRLQQTIAEWEAENADRIPPNIRELTDRTVQDLISSGIAERVLGPGELARDFRLANAHGEDIPLAGMLVHGPAVLSFQRGTWCPYARLEFEALNAIVPELAQRGATLVGITPDQPEMTAKFVARHPLDFEILCDVYSRVARRYRLLFELPEALIATYREYGADIFACEAKEHCELPMPATYIITPAGRIHTAFVHADHRRRTEPGEILSALDALRARESTATG